MGQTNTNLINKYDWNPNIYDNRDSIIKMNKLTHGQKNIEIIDLRGKIKICNNHRTSTSNCLATYMKFLNFDNPIILGSNNIRDCYNLINMNNNDVKPKLYRIIPTLYQLKRALCENLLILTGIPIYESFNDKDKNGIVQLPKENDRLIGGLCVLICGINADCWIVQTMDVNIGEDGILYIPHKYFPEDSYDFWIMKKDDIPLSNDV